MGLVDLHADWMRRRNLSKATIAKRLQRLRKFEAHVGLRDATPEDIDEFLDRQRGRDGGALGAKARYQWVSDLHCFYKWAGEWGHLTVDPTVRVPRPKQRRRLPRPIATADLVVGLQMAGPTMRRWLTLGAFAGLRVGEMASLEVDSIRWDDDKLQVIGKGDKERLVDMHPFVRQELSTMRLPTRGPVFRRPRGGKYPAWQVSQEISGYFADLGIGATAHQLRHWYGTQLYRQCRDLRMVQEQMGHDNPQTTASYADFSRAEAAEAVARISLDDAHDSPNLFSEWTP